MKNLILVIGSFILLTSCTDNGNIGPRGPAGLPGPEGAVGAAGESGYVFEYSNINFTAPDYAAILAYPDDFEGLVSDVALAYLLWDVQEIGSELIDVWRPLPQTVFTENGTLQYNFDFTAFDVRLFLDSNFSLDLLTAFDTDEWVVRVVVVPGDFLSGGRLDVSDYYELAETLKLPEIGVHKKAIVRRN